MKKFALAIAILAAAPLAAAADVTKEDIKKLVAAGISDDVIVSYIRNNGPVVKLSADDVIELKQAGASDKVLSVMTGASPAPAARADGFERVVERPVYVPQTTYVYSTPSYSYPSYSSVWCYRHSCYDYCVGYSTPYYTTSSYCYPSYSYYPRHYSYYYPSVGFSYYRSGRSHGWGYRVGFGWCR